MPLSTVRPTADEIETAVERYSDALFRLCFTMLGSAADAEDAVSDCFVKYIERAPRFRLRRDEHLPPVAGQFSRFFHFSS